MSISQPFWGNIIARAGAGPKPIPYASLTFQRLSDAIQFCLTPQAIEAARKISVNMQWESGVTTAVESFHRNLPLNKMRCTLIPDQVATWKYRKGKKSLALSQAAVHVLIEHQKIKETDLQQSVSRFCSVYALFNHRFLLQISLEPNCH